MEPSQVLMRVTVDTLSARVRELEEENRSLRERIDKVKTRVAALLEGLAAGLRQDVNLPPSRFQAIQNLASRAARTSSGRHRCST